MMKKLQFTVFALALILFAWGTYSCSDDDDNTNNPPATIVLTQAGLNGATTAFDMAVTGKKYGDASIAHNGSATAGVYDTYRDIYTNLKSKDVSKIVPGNIIAKKVYARGADGSKGDLLVTFAMMKREAGYDVDNHDWEYVMMPASSTVDYSAMPNGKLPAVTVTAQRGKLASCAACHNKAADNSGLFIKNMPTTITVTQDDLDYSVSMFEMNITGKKYGDATIAHNGTTVTPDKTFRDVYSNWAAKDQEIVPGSIVTKHTFLKQSDGTKGELAVTFAMVKREVGYWPEGKDWEYIMMPKDATVDYTKHKNGILPTVSTQKGKLASCNACHMKSNHSSFLFVRN